MNTKQTIWIYAIATFILLIDYLLMDFGIEYALMMMVLFLLPVLGISALLVLICVMLWKKSVQLSKDDIFFFVVYNTAFSYGALAAVLLIIMLFRMVF
ncbi:MAG: hypothetical protein E7496_08965 [Ruminococcus sp.]|nr:hypothetical protein [Ruminococcus sp.]